MRVCEALRFVKIMAQGSNTLTRQQVVDKLDSVPVFNVVTNQNKIVGVPDAERNVAIRFYVDPDEASSALVLAQTLSPEPPLHLTVTPLGTAFALLEGWTDAPTQLPFRLRAPRAPCSFFHNSSTALCFFPRSEARIPGSIRITSGGDPQRSSGEVPDQTLDPDR